MQIPSDYEQRIDEDGYAIVPECLCETDLRRLAAGLERTVERAGQHVAIRSRGGVYAIRNLLDTVPECRELCRHPSIRALIEPILGAEAGVVRASLFEKSVDANWGVFWHQDLSIAVRQRAEVHGFGSWIRKAGVDCVQPPLEIMQGILTVRLHLDDCSVSNGALKVLPGSHRLARIPDARIAREASTRDPVVCAVQAGGALVMRPLLLHSSSRAETAAQRRVLHFEFSADELPSPLEWHCRVPLV